MVTKFSLLKTAIRNDPNWKNGFYYSGTHPHAGLKLAREIATIGYRSGQEWESRFGRDKVYAEEELQTPPLNPEFLIETYLDHQGKRFRNQYDPNSLLYISKAMDLFDLSRSATHGLQKKRAKNVSNLTQVQEHHFKFGLNPQRTAEASRLIGDYHQSSIAFSTAKHMPMHRSRQNDTSAVVDQLGDLTSGLSPIKMPSLVVGVQTNNLFPVEQQREIASCLKKSGNSNVEYLELDSIYGHNTFLIDIDTTGNAIKHLLDSILL